MQTQWNNKRDLPIFGILIFVILFLNIKSKNNPIIPYFFGEKSSGKVISFDSKIFTYKYLDGDYIRTIKTKQRKSFVIEDYIEIELITYKKYIPIMLSIDGYKRVYSSLFVVLFFTLVLFIVTMFTFFNIRKEKGDTPQK